MRTVNFGFGQGYDSGRQPSISINKKNIILEMHTSQWLNTLWYNIGEYRRDIFWLTSEAQKLDTGLQPSCGLMSDGTAVEVHRAEADFSLWHRVGSVSGNTANWSESVNYTTGFNPSIAINDAGVVVEVHQGIDAIWCRAGHVESGQIDWGSDVRLDGGYNPKITINDNNDVVLVYNNSGIGGIATRAGSVNVPKLTIDWGPIAITSLSGHNPAVALNNAGEVFQVYQDALTYNSQLVSTTGALNTALRMIDGLRPWFTYGFGIAPSIACNDNVAVANWVGTNDNTLIGSASLIYSRSTWMIDNLAQLANKTLRDIAIPGCHDAGIIADPPAIREGDPGRGQCQDLSLYDQMLNGARYFDLRPSFNSGGKFQIVHDVSVDIGMAHIPILKIPGILLRDVLEQTKRFLSETKEFVILKFSHFDDTITSARYRDMIKIITDTLSGFLFTDNGRDLSTVQLREFLNNQGKGRAIIVCDNNGRHLPGDNPAIGIHIYNDIGVYNPLTDPARWKPNLIVYDKYSETFEYEKMRNDQLDKFAQFSPKDTANSPSAIFLLSWTCTPDFTHQSNWTLSHEPNSNMAHEILQTPNPNRAMQRINIVYTDFFQYARATDVCLIMNNLTPFIAFSPLLVSSVRKVKPKSLMLSSSSIVQSKSFNTFLPNSKAFNQTQDIDQDLQWMRAIVLEQPLAGDFGSFLLKSKIIEQQKENIHRPLTISSRIFKL